MVWRIMARVVKWVLYRVLGWLVIGDRSWHGLLSRARSRIV